MTNQTPESVIAEAMVNAGAPLMHSRVEEGVASALRAANMLREPGVPDAATAAIERARVEVESINQAAQKSLCGSEPDHAGIYEGAARALAALDGAPEPDWEYVGQAFEANGFMRIQNEHLTPEKFDSWRKLMAQYPRVEILKRVKAVPAGPWLPVEGEGK